MIHPDLLACFKPREVQCHLLKAKNSARRVSVKVLRSERTAILYDEYALRCLLRDAMLACISVERYRRVIDVYRLLRYRRPLIGSACVAALRRYCAIPKSKLSTWAKSLLAGAVQHEYFESATLIHRLLERIGEAVAMRIHNIELRAQGLTPNTKTEARSYLEQSLRLALA